MAGLEGDSESVGVGESVCERVSAVGGEECGSECESGCECGCG